MTDDSTAEKSTESVNVQHLIEDLPDVESWLITAGRHADAGLIRLAVQGLRERSLALAEVREEIEGYSRILDKQGKLLTGAVNALRGDPPALTIWSHHDVAELAAAKITELSEAQATIERVDSWFNDLGDTPCPNGEALARILDTAPLSAPSSTGGNALADVKAQAVHEAAEAIRHHCTAPGEPLNADPLIAFVADWIENPPEWVEVSYRKGNDRKLIPLEEVAEELGIDLEGGNDRE